MRASSAVRLSLPTAHRSASTVRHPRAVRAAPRRARPTQRRRRVAPSRDLDVRSHRTSPRVDRRGDVAVAHAAAATATAASVVPEIAIALSLGYLVASFVAFWWGASHPRSAAATFLRSPLPLVPLCVAYLALLCASWSPDTLSLMMPGSLAEGLATGQPQFFPRLDGIMTLLSRRVTASSAWLQSRASTFSSVSRRESRRVANSVAHTLLLTSITGPIGLLSHWITQEVFAGSKARERRRAMTAARLRPRCASSSASTAASSRRDAVRGGVRARVRARVRGRPRRDAWGIIRETHVAGQVPDASQARVLRGDEKEQPQTLRLPPCHDPTAEAPPSSTRSRAGGV